MASDWEPPEYRVLAPYLPHKDFLCWMQMAPVVSERAMKILVEFFDPNDVEFLELAKIRSRTYFAVNVLRVVDCLDLEKSEILWSETTPGRIVSVATFVLDKKRVPDAKIFKALPDSPCFVTDEMVELVKRHGLTNAGFADPSKNPFELHGRGLPLNIVPDLP